VFCASLRRLCPGRGVCLAWDAITPLFLQVGAFVLDPKCGLGTVLLEAAKEWPVSIAVAQAGPLQDALYLHQEKSLPQRYQSV